MSRAALPLVAVAALIAMTLGAGATSEVDQAGPGWVLLRYHGGTENSTIEVTSSFSGPGILSVDARFNGGGGSDSRATWTGRQVEATAGPASVRVVGIPFSVTLSTNLYPGREGLVLVWAMSQSDAWSWSVDLAPGATLSVVDSGTDGYFMLGSGANSGVHAHAALGYQTAGFSNATYAFDVEHLFIGYAGLRPPQSITDRITLRFPDGSSQICPCRDTWFPHGDWLAGRYTLDWTGASLGDQTILLAGVDVEGFPPAWS